MLKLIYFKFCGSKAKIASKMVQRLLRIEGYLTTEWKDQFQIFQLKHLRVLFCLNPHYHYVVRRYFKKFSSLQSTFFEILALCPLKCRIHFVIGFDWLTQITKLTTCISANQNSGNSKMPSNVAYFTIFHYMYVNSKKNSLL